MSAFQHAFSWNRHRMGRIYIKCPHRTSMNDATRPLILSRGQPLPKMPANTVFSTAATLITSRFFGYLDPLSNTILILHGECQLQTRQATSNTPYSLEVQPKIQKKYGHYIYTYTTTGMKSTQCCRILHNFRIHTRLHIYTLWFRWRQIIFSHCPADPPARTPPGCVP